MIYSSASFIFFVAFALLIFFFLSVKLRTHWLFLTSLLWLISWNWKWAILFSGISCFNLLALHIFKSKKAVQKKQLFPLLIAINVFIFVLAKSASFLGTGLKTPYGISFFMFMHIGFIFDVWRSSENFSVENEHLFLLFPSFFPQLVGGPIMRGKDFFPQVRSGLQFQWQNLIDGTIIFAVGFCKFYFLSKAFMAINNALLLATTRISFVFIILFGISGTFQAYIDFSSFCDMGRGIAKCFGINFPVNFMPFYFAKNPNDFWQRWNITLGTWIRDYISFPLMFRFGRKLNPNWILFSSFVLVGLWHGLTFNWILFGVFNGLMIIGFNFANKKSKGRFPGYLFSMFIFIGNGILQRTNFMTIFISAINRPALLNLPSVFPEYLNKVITAPVIFAFCLLLTYDTLIEKKGADWPVTLPKNIRIFLFLFLIILFLAGLHTNHFLEDITLPPAYFRI
jgi:alginate O-acetyltransferase complex protein AlgI